MELYADRAVTGLNGTLWKDRYFTFLESLDPLNPIEQVAHLQNLRNVQPWVAPELRVVDRYCQFVIHDEFPNAVLHVPRHWRSVSVARHILRTKNL